MSNHLPTAGLKTMAEAVLARPNTEEGSNVCGYAEISKITEANSHTRSFQVKRK